MSAVMYELKKRIKEHEGLRLKPYADDKGKITIGYGHNLTDNGITREQAERIFDDDIRTAKQEIASKMLYFIVKLPDEKYGVLIELVFWIGIGRALEFKKMLSALKAKDWNKAADELLDSRLGREYPTRTGELADVLRSIK